MIKFFKKYGLALLLTVAVLAGLSLFYTKVSKIGDAPRAELTQIMDSVSSSLPQSYKTIDKKYNPGDFVDSAPGLAYKYEVSGTREDAYQNVVSALGLDKEEHKESYDQNLNGVGSPRFKYTFFLSISPSDAFEFLDNDPCLANGEDDLAWKICKNKDLKRGKNLPAQTMEIKIIKR